MDYKKIIKNKNIRLKILNILFFIPDEIILKLEYRLKFGEKLNLKNPTTFNEKLQWLKLYDRRDIYTLMVDKLEVKKLISSKIGEEYTVPTLGFWDSFEEINFDKLPNQFVLKCNHDSGSIMLCKNKKYFNYKKAKNHFDFHLKNDEYLLGRKWPYKNVPRKIIAEPFLHEDNDKELFVKDYKFFCFGGVPKIMYISNDKGEDPRTDFFDMEFKHLPIKMKDPNSDIYPKCPFGFEKMKKIASILSKDIPHLRVDFYVVNQRIYVGELTFFHNSGFNEIKPKEWDLLMGSWIKLPNNK